MHIILFIYEYNISSKVIICTELKDVCPSVQHWKSKVLNSYWLNCTILSVFTPTFPSPQSYIGVWSTTMYKASSAWLDSHILLILMYLKMFDSAYQKVNELIKWNRVYKFKHSSLFKKLKVKVRYNFVSNTKQLMESYVYI